MNILLGLTMAFYFTGMIGFHAYVLVQKQVVYRVANILLLLGFLCHTFAMFLTYSDTGHIPINGLHEILSSLGWMLVGAYLILQLKYNLRVLGALVSPLAVLFVVLATIIPQQTIVLHPVVRGLWRTAHISALIIGNAAFAIACMVGIMYLLQEKAIKEKKHNFFFRRLPSLELLDSMGYGCLVAGFPLLTFGIVTGVIYSQIVRGSLLSWSIKDILGLITWVIYGALIQERLTLGLRRQRAAFMTIAGFTVFLATFVVALVH